MKRVILGRILKKCLGRFAHNEFSKRYEVVMESADAPRCIACLNLGRYGQTFRVFGQSGSVKFKCSSCGATIYKNDIPQIELEWRTKPEEWQAYITKKLNGDGKNSVKKILEVSKL